MPVDDNTRHTVYHFYNFKMKNNYSTFKTKIILFLIIFLSFSSFLLYSQGGLSFKNTDIKIKENSKYDPGMPSSDQKIEIFVNLKNYQVIDKNTINMEIEIQKLQLSGFEDEGHKKKIQKYPGTRYFVTGNLPEKDTLSKISLKLIDVETDDIVYQTKENIEVNSDELLKLTGELRNKIVEIEQIWNISVFINKEISEAFFVGRHPDSKYIVKGNLKGIDQLFALSLKLINFKTGVLVSQVTGEIDVNLKELLKQTKSSSDKTVEIEPVSDNLGSIYVFSNKNESDVFLNGTLRGKTPLLIKDIQKGHHLLEVKKGNYYYKKKIAVIEKEIAGINAELKILKGYLYVRTVPEGLNIFIDNNFYGQTPMYIKNIDAGFHILSLEKDWYTKTEEIIEIKPHETKTIHKKLTETGRLSIEILNNSHEVENITIEKDKGKHSFVVGSEGINVYEELPEGNYTINVNGKNIKTYEKEIFIEPGETLKLQVNPEYTLEYTERETEKNITIANLENFKNKKDVYFKAGYITAGGSIVSASSAILFYLLAKDQLGKYNTSYAKYQQAATTEEAMVYRDIAQDHYDNSKSFKTAEYISLGVAVLSTGLSAFLFLRRPKDGEIQDLEIKINSYSNNNYGIKGYFSKKF